MALFESKVLGNLDTVVYCLALGIRKKTDYESFERHLIGKTEVSQENGLFV
jgi:hypothetical protein